MVTFPAVVIRPTVPTGALLVSKLVNHSAPSGPAVMWVGPAMPVWW